MTRDELQEYAAANRERLKKQNVAIGDVVKILVGHFAGEQGVVKGIRAFGDELDDPYYEVELDCEVPDKYNTRKGYVPCKGAIGCLSARELEVIGDSAHLMDKVSNLSAPNSEPKRDPDIHVKDGDAEYKIWNGDDNHVFLKAAIEADKPTHRFKVGDKVMFRISQNEWRAGEIASLERGYARVRLADGDIFHIKHDALRPYEEPTAEKDEHPLNKRIRDITAILSKENENYKRMAEQIANSNGLKPINYDVNVSTSEGKEENDTSAAAVERGIKLSEEVCRKMLDGTVDMEKYRMELAAKIAVAYASKKECYEPKDIPAIAVGVANGVVERIKNSKV